MTENEYNNSVNIVADITDKAITFQENMLGVAIETWGYCKEDVEKALLELEQYRKLGTVEECREAVEKTKAKKPIKKYGQCYKKDKNGNEYFEYSLMCPRCKKDDLKNGYPCKCGQILDWRVKNERY